MKHVRKRQRIETSKKLLGLILSTYFLGVIIGAWVVIRAPEQLGEYLVFIGTATGIVIPAYTLKARSENIIKINKGMEGEHEQQGEGYNGNNNSGRGE